MQKIQCLLFVLNRSYISDIIFMTVPLTTKSRKIFSEKAP